MKAAILTGKLRTCVGDANHLEPSLITEIGDKPILGHITKIYS